MHAALGYALGVYLSLGGILAALALAFWEEIRVRVAADLGRAPRAGRLEIVLVLVLLWLPLVVVGALDRRRKQ